jgi:hypothetical protein
MTARLCVSVLALSTITATASARQASSQFAPVKPATTINTYKPSQPMSAQPWTTKPSRSSSQPQAPAAKSLGTLNGNPYSANSLANPYGAGNPLKPDGLKNPFSANGSPFSNTSATNPYATQPPKIYDDKGNYRGELSTNPYRKDSVSNPYGEYGNPYSPKSINNPYGAGNPYSTDILHVVPGSVSTKGN